ncbi:uncharacterized protein LOC115625488 [Scaptodrosophila lebanonensis]|uniref:Uncharacterized protein LOC115625488 n=1 Tax=Drosophila lebanonensis TaxID=7225 RepID=A0A6J2TMM8_DROLE|nr:uncharacterized protein LOC115625488 [Scaptodrosophila lebanonensis]
MFKFKSVGEVFNNFMCLCVTIIWVQCNFINAMLDFLLLCVPLSLVRPRLPDSEERPLVAECTLGAISAWLFAF